MCSLSDDGSPRRAPSATSLPCRAASTLSNHRNSRYHTQKASAARRRMYVAPAGSAVRAAPPPRIADDRKQREKGNVALRRTQPIWMPLRGRAAAWRPACLLSCRGSYCTEAIRMRFPAPRFPDILSGLKSAQVIHLMPNLMEAQTERKSAVWARLRAYKNRNIT